MMTQKLFNAYKQVCLSANRKPSLKDLEKLSKIRKTLKLGKVKGFSKKIH